MNRRILSRKEREAIQQPLSKDGYSNPYFDKLYGKDKNPYILTERDRNRKHRNIPVCISKRYSEGWKRIFKENNDE